MVRAYTMFPGRGFNVKPIFISRIEDRNGNVLATFTPESKEVISEADAYVMTKMMQGVVDFGTGRALRSAYGITSEVAGKTGTTNDNADGWFIGFTPQLLAGVWVGADDPLLRLLNTTGGAQMAMPAWGYFFQEVYKDKTLDIDPAARFSIPDILQNEAVYDYEALTRGDQPPPAEGEDAGSGSSSDFIDVPVSDGTEKVTTESKKIDDDEDKKNDKLKPGDKFPPADTVKKKKGFFKRLFGKKKNEE